MTDKEYGITEEHSAVDWRETPGWGRPKTIPDIDVMNISNGQKQFTQQHNVMLLAYSAFTASANSLKALFVSRMGI